MKKVNWLMIASMMFCVLFWLFVACLCGCSWQGQRHHISHEGKKVLVSEWWSMRFLWMSNGVECYTETPYYKTGSQIQNSQSDPNAIEAAGTAVGNIGKAVIK